MVFLVLLRLAIGWHFLIEAHEKFTGDSWTSEPYLRGSVGPLAPTFRWLAGDQLLDKLTPRPLAGGEDPLKVPMHERMPPALAREWDAYFKAFADHYQLDADQRTRARVRFEQQEDQTVVWLLQSKKGVSVTSPYGPPVTSEKTIPERIQDCQDKLVQGQIIETQELPANATSLFKGEVAGRAKALRDDANRTRAELRADLGQQTQQMKDGLREVLTSDQRIMAPMPDRVEASFWTQSRLEWIDASVRWGLLLVGICLLLGLFSRPACVAGAAFLLAFYLAMPPLLGVPDNPRVEGHYFLINKNIIEMLALLVLATTPSGRWLGLDGLLQFLNPWRWRAAPASADVPVDNGQPAARRTPVKSGYGLRAGD
jgi:uncharacterized membrane protein YphA (DoxX/SURF4 family)